jgi:hypothetical protein
MSIYSFLILYLSNVCLLLALRLLMFHGISHIKHVYNMDLKTETHGLDGKISKN